MQLFCEFNCILWAIYLKWQGKFAAKQVLTCLPHSSKACGMLYPQQTKIHMRLFVLLLPDAYLCYLCTTWVCVSSNFYMQHIINRMKAQHATAYLMSIVRGLIWFCLVWLRLYCPPPPPPPPAYSLTPSYSPSCSFKILCFAVSSYNTLCNCERINVL